MCVCVCVCVCMCIQPSFLYYTDYSFLKISNNTPYTLFLTDTAMKHTKVHNFLSSYPCDLTASFSN